MEYWDGATETAWICEPASPYHERPSGRLTRLTERIAQVRGAPIESYGSMDLRQRNGPRSIMQADESVYLHPGSARLPGPSAMVIGVDDYPDLVLEVDHTQRRSIDPDGTGSCRRFKPARSAPCSSLQPELSVAHHPG